MLNRTLLARSTVAVLTIGGLVPFFTGAARVIVPPITRLAAPLALVLPFWSALLFGVSFVLACALLQRSLRFTSTTRPLLLIVAGAWALDATGFWRLGLPVDRLTQAESVRAMFELVARNLHEDWVIGGSLLGWIILTVIVVLAVTLEAILSRKGVR